MIKLGQLSKTKKIEIDIDGEKLLLTVKSGLTVGEQMSINERYPNLSDPTSEGFKDDSISMLADLIVDWNVHDDNGKKVELSKENFELLPGSVIPEITEAVGLNAGNQEKKSFSPES